MFPFKEERDKNQLTQSELAKFFIISNISTKQKQKHPILITAMIITVVYKKAKRFIKKWKKTKTKNNKNKNVRHYRYWRSRINFVNMYCSLFENFEYNGWKVLNYHIRWSLLLRVKKVWKVVANWCWKVLNLVDLDGCHVWNWW